MTPLLSILAVILGLMMGSFLSMLIPRLHNEEKGIILGRSKCPNCKKTLQTRDLMPLISYIINNGKCRFCKKEIALWYPMMELTSAITFGVLFFYSPDPIPWIINVLFFSVLLFIFFYDLRYSEIHDVIMLPAIALALLYAVISGNAENALIGAAIGSLFYLLQLVLSGGKWVGSGDIRIGAFLGLMLGWKLTITALILSYLIGSIVGVTLILTKKLDRKSAIPMGPFLVIGTVIAFFYGQNLIEWYLNLTGL